MLLKSVHIGRKIKLLLVGYLSDQLIRFLNNLINDEKFVIIFLIYKTIVK